MPIPTHLLFYLGLGALLTAEEAGVFLLPGDISIVAAGVYAAQGGPLIYISWLVASSGMVAGSMVLFSVVRRSKSSTRALPERVGTLVRRHGALGVAAARLIPGLRNASVFAAGAASLPARQFLLGLIPAALAWSGLLLLAGWFGGNAILGLMGRLDGHPILRLLSVALVLAAGLFWVVRIRMVSREPIV